MQTRTITVTAEELDILLRLLSKDLAEVRNPNHWPISQGLLKKLTSAQ